jgi:hypothetical protein
VRSLVTNELDRLLKKGPGMGGPRPGRSVKPPLGSVTSVPRSIAISRKKARHPDTSHKCARTQMLAGMKLEKNS